MKNTLQRYGLSGYLKDTDFPVICKQSGLKNMFYSMN